MAIKSSTSKISNEIQDYVFEDDEFMKEYVQRRIDKAFEVQEYKDESELVKLTASKTMIIHFYEPSYKTCSAINAAFRALTRKFPDIQFGFISVYDCSLMVESLKIRTLPFIGFFRDGYFVDELVGFEGLENSKKTGILKVEELERYIRMSKISAN